MGVPLPLRGLKIFTRLRHRPLALSPVTPRLWLRRDPHRSLESVRNPADPFQSQGPLRNPGLLRHHGQRPRPARHSRLQLRVLKQGPRLSLGRRSHHLLALNPGLRHRRRGPNRDRSRNRGPRRSPDPPRSRNRGPRLSPDPHLNRNPRLRQNSSLAPRANLARNTRSESRETGSGCSSRPQRRPGEQLAQPKRAVQLAGHEEFLAPLVIRIFQLRHHPLIARRRRFEVEDR